MQKLIPIATLTLVLAALLIKLPTRTIVDAASHREAPLISQDPLADNTDVYAFVSPDRPDTVTILANYIPFEEPSGGPGYFRFDPNVLYEIKIDNTGDGEEDIVYQFRFKNTIANPDTFLIHRGPGVLGVDSDAQISSLNDPDYNLKQTYSVIRKVRRSRHAFDSTVLGTDLISPPPNIGTGATPNYGDLALAAINTIGDGIKVFAGQRDEAFYIDLGAIFDRFELRTLGVPSGLGAPRDATQGYNVHTITLQIPKRQLTNNGEAVNSSTAPNAVIGIYASASRRKFTVLRGGRGAPETAGPWVQVSRMGNPLVNELFVPLKNRDRWNATDPADESQFRDTEIVTPEVPAGLDVLYGTNTAGSGILVRALKPFPTANRTDLELVLFKGIPVNPITGPNYTTVIGGDISKVAYADLLRLNMGISPDVAGSGSSLLLNNDSGVRRLGLLGGDMAGFPNGRRLTDDAVDIFLRAAAAGTPFSSLLFPDFVAANGDPNQAPNNALSDGVDQNAEGHLVVNGQIAFPYLNHPVGGAQSKPHEFVAP
jgi:hypothetical protein